MEQNTKKRNNDRLWRTILPLMSAFLLITGAIAGIYSWAIWNSQAPASDLDLFVFLYAVGAVVIALAISSAIANHDADKNGTIGGGGGAVFGT